MYFTIGNGRIHIEIEGIDMGHPQDTFHGFWLEALWKGVFKSDDPTGQRPNVPVYHLVVRPY